MPKLEVVSLCILFPVLSYTDCASNPLESLAKTLAILVSLPLLSALHSDRLSSFFTSNLLGIFDIKSLIPPSNSLMSGLLKLRSLTKLDNPK